MQSKEEDLNFFADEGIRSTTTIEIVSHWQRLLQALTLAAAEKQLQILHKEQRQRKHDVDDNELFQQFVGAPDGETKSHRQTFLTNTRVTYAKE